MASFKLGLYVVSVLALHLFPSPVLCKDEEQDLLHDINTYRKVLDLPVLTELDKMSCIADEIADDIDDKYQCEDFRDHYPVPGSNPKIPNFQDNAEKCKIDMNTTKDGIIMPVCVQKLDQDALFSNYTRSNRFTKYLNSSKYTVAGLGSEDDWMVLIISTNTPSGDFSSATSLLAGAWKGHYCLVLAFFLSALIVLIN